MRKTRIFFLLLIVIVLIAAVGCSSNDAATQESAAQSETQTDPSTAVDDAASDKVFTLDELKTYDGQNGNPAYVAVNGTVYDVTDVRSWNGGKHNGLSAGADLTDAIGNSPHGTKVLKNLPVVGTLE